MPILASSLLGCGVAAVGALVLLGWIRDIDALKSAYGPITMKTNMAIGLLLCGTSLWSHARGFRRLGIACASLAAGLGAITLSEHAFAWNPGIDEALFTEAVGAAATASPNRMGPNGATSLVLVGVAVLLLFRATPRAVRSAQWLAVVSLVLATFALAGYLYGAVELYALARYTGIALNTAAAFVALDISILLARVDYGPMATMTGEGAAGMLLRRLTVPIVLIPLALGYVVTRGRRADLFDPGLSIALFAVSTVIILVATLWHTAKVIGESDQQRRRAEEERDQLLARERLARGEAESASRLKDEFLAVLSHELRTPLNVMLGWTKMLESGATPDRHAHAAAVVTRNGRLLARLVEDLLDISRITAGQLHIAPAPTYFNGVVQASLDAMRPVAAEKGVRLVGELDLAIGTIHGDAERLQQIVWNLLSNAIKFTPAGGGVYVRTTLDGATATMTVEDSGIGFDAAFASELFRPFRQADPSTRREHGGLGLGLSIARHIADLHGGSLTGASAGPGRGATFTLKLPVMTAVSARTNSEARRHAPLRHLD